MSKKLTRYLSLLGVAAIAVLAGCDDSSTNPPDPAVPAEIELSPEELSLAEVGDTEVLSAVVRDEDGVEIPDAEVEWGSSDESVAVVDEDGVVEAVGEGVAEITATSGEVSAQAEVTVDLEEEEEES